MTDPFFSSTAVADTDIPQEVEVGDEEFVFTEEDSRGSGGFKPRITPGPVTFRFELVEYKPPTAESANHIFGYTAHVKTVGLPPERLLQDRGQDEVPVLFNRIWAKPATKNKETGKFENRPFELERLYAGLGFLTEFGPATFDQMVERIRQHSAGRVVAGSVKWEAAKKFDSGTQLFTTSPRLRRKVPDRPWPARVEGKLPIEVTFADGSTKFAREVIGAVYAPKVAKT